MSSRPTLPPNLKLSVNSLRVNLIPLSSLSIKIGLSPVLSRGEHSSWLSSVTPFNTTPWTWPTSLSLTQWSVYPFKLWTAFPGELCGWKHWRPSWSPGRLHPTLFFNHSVFHLVTKEHQAGQENYLQMSEYGPASPAPFFTNVKHSVFKSQS